MDSVLICLPQKGNDMITTSNDADKELVKYLKHSSNYKIGESERVIYQKINKLKTANASLSILYAKSSESSIEFSSKMGLIIPSFDWNVKQAYE